MNRFFKILQTYLIWGLPAVLTIMAWGSFQDEDQVQNVMLHGVWAVLGWNIMLWFVALIVYLLLLVVVPRFREQTLTRLAQIRERDEREEYITGRAARKSYISTLSFLVFLFFLSAFTFSVKKELDPQGKHTGTVSLGLQFHLFEKKTVETSKDGVILESSDLPITKSAILLSVLIWQVLSFAIPARRQSREITS
jgi:hypothetical protein